MARVFLLASAVVPVGLKPVTNWAWVSGLVLVGVGVLAVAVAVSGLYPILNVQDSWLATLGLLGGVVAGIAAVGIIAMAGIALIGEGVLGMDLGKPVGIFSVVTLSMAGGTAFGMLSTGTVGLRSAAISRTPSLLLLVGGASLIVPVLGEVLRRGFGIETGLPPWLFIPALGLITLDSLAIGHTLRPDA